MKTIKTQIALLIMLLASAGVWGQYFSDVSNAFDMDTKVPYVSSWCIEEGSYFMPGQEIIITFSLSEGNFLSVELGFSDVEGGDIQILQTLPYPEPAFITIPEVPYTAFAKFYIIAKDTYGHENYYPIPYEGYFNIGPHIQSVDVPVGWSGISNPMFPVDSYVGNILANVMNDVVILQDMENVYWPGGNVYTLSNWEIFKGYLIKAQTPFSVDLEGTSMNNCIWYGLTFPEGWFLFSVPGKCDLDAQQFFDWNLWTSEIIKEAAGWRVLWPDYNINTLEVLERGKSYFIKSDWANEDWAPNPCWEGEDRILIKEPDTPHAWNKPYQTPLSHTIAIPENVVNSNKLPDDAIIGAFSQEGLCVGISPVEAYHLTVFGNDPTTETIDGMLPNDMIYFKVWGLDGQNEMELIPEFDLAVGWSDGTFVPDGLSVITGFKLEALSVDDFSAQRIGLHPNPASTIVYITTGGGQNFHMEMVDNRGSVVYESSFNSRCTIDLTNHAPGLYFVKIFNEETFSMKKLMVK